MKIKINLLTIVTLLLLVFCVSYLLTRLIVNDMYVDAAFAIAVPVLLGLLIYFIKKGI